MEICTVTRSRFTKTGKCVHTHTIAFASPEDAKKYVSRSKQIDDLYNFPKGMWQYDLHHKAIY